MLNKIVHTIWKPKHPWRQMQFDELSELYISMLFRGLAISMTGLFVPIYMIKLGYSAGSFFYVVACYFTARFFIFDIAAAYTVARIGPKHSMLIGYILLACNTSMFLTIETINWPLWLLGVVWGGSMSYFIIPFHVDFSKVKHSIHGGKELSYVQIMEKAGAALGPVIGGLIATYLGAQYLFLLATLMIVFGIIPLFATREPTKVRQHISLYGLPFRRLKRDYFSVAAYGIENTLSISLWPVFIALFVFVDSTVYTKVGFLSTVAIISGILAAYAIGKTIDNKKGRALLRVSAITNSLIHLIRPFITTFSGAFMVTVSNDVVTTGYRMPYQKGWYDAADDLPGYRIAYIASVEWFSSLFKGLAWWFLLLITAFFSDYTVVCIGFFIASIASLLIMTERFKALNPRRR